MTAETTVVLTYEPGDLYGEAADHGSAAGFTMYVVLVISNNADRCASILYNGFQKQQLTRVDLERHLTIKDEFSEKLL